MTRASKESCRRFFFFFFFFFKCAKNIRHNQLLFPAKKAPQKTQDTRTRTQRLMGICASKEDARSESGTTVKRTSTTGAGAGAGATGQNATTDKPSFSSNDKSDFSGPTEPQAGAHRGSTTTTTQANEPRKQSIVPSESSLNGMSEITSTNLNNSVSESSKTKHHDYTKVLLLGTGESGKSTILQQLKILHSNGFTRHELYDFKPFIFSNIVSSAKGIIEAYEKFNIRLDDDDEIDENDFDLILSYKAPVDPAQFLDRKIAKKIRALWKNASTLELLKDHNREFYLMDSAKYFFEELERISLPDYLPNETDVIRTRKKTSGIFDLKFELQGINIHIFDVGGQRSERKKWIYCFDNVASIIFCVALSEYDQNLLEEKTQNRLEESLTLFDSVVNSRWFSRCSIILFLNKIDIFVEKLPYSPLENYFPDYTGGNDANKAAKYILWRFTKVNRSGLPIYPYITQATDTNNIKLVFVVVRETIFSNLLQDTGLL